MKRQLKHITLVVLALLTAAGAWAQTPLKGTVLLNGTEIPAEYVKLSDGAYLYGGTVALGNGINACISQYSEGRIAVPATVKIGNKSYLVTKINDMAFRLCDKITFVELRGNVTRIGNFAFKGCSSLHEVVLPASLQSIGSGAFVNTPLYSILCAGETPPVWEYNDVFRYKKDGIGDTNAEYVGSGVRVSVPENAVEAYKNALYSDESLGWTTPDGWGRFSGFNNEYLNNYRVYTPEDLEGLYRLTDDEVENVRIMKRITFEADIDMTGRDVWTHGISNYLDGVYMGVVDGQNHTITGLQVVNDYSSHTAVTGLFTAFGGDTIRNLRLKDCRFDGPGDAGAIVGSRTFGDTQLVLENIYVAASVSGSTNVGGLVGAGDGKNIKMTNCVFSGGVGSRTNQTYFDDFCAGGLIGLATYATIQNCAVLGGITKREDTQCGPFVGKAWNPSYANVSISNSYCVHPFDNSYFDNTINGPYPSQKAVKYGKNVVIAGRDSYDMYVGGTVARTNTFDSDNMKSFGLASHLGTDNWVYKYGEYPLPTVMEDFWPVEVNVFTLRPASMTEPRTNGLVLLDKVPAAAWHSRDETGDTRLFHTYSFKTSRLWFDESINVDILDRPQILPLGIANITATDGIEYVREIRAKYVGEQDIVEQDFEKDAEGNPVLDANGEPIFTDGTIVVGKEQVFNAVGYSACLPFSATLPDDCRAYQPTEVLTDGDATIIQFRQVAGNRVEAFNPYYIVVEKDTVILSTEAETICPPATKNVISLSGFDFVGTAKKIDNYHAFYENAYILQSDGKWHRVINGADEQQNQAYIPAFRSYFRKTNSSSSAQQLLMSFVDDQATDIDAIQTIDLDGTERYYDLNGRLLPGRPTHGFYIRNGRKYYAK